MSDSNDGLAIGLGILGAVGLGVLAVGTETGRTISGGILDAYAEGARRDAERRHELHSAEELHRLRRDLCDKELELVKAKQSYSYSDVYGTVPRLEGEIEVLKRAIERLA